MIFSRLALLPGEIQRDKLSVFAEIDAGPAMLMHLHATDRRLILSRPRFSEYLAIPAFFVAGLLLLLFGVIGGGLAAALIVYILVGQKLQTKSTFALSEVAACTYQKRVGLFSADRVLVVSRTGETWRLTPSGKQSSAFSVATLLETAGFVVTGIPTSWTARYL